MHQCVQHISMMMMTHVTGGMCMDYAVADSKCILVYEMLYELLINDPHGAFYGVFIVMMMLHKTKKEQYQTSTTVYCCLDFQ